MPYSKETSVILEKRETWKAKTMYIFPQKSMKIQVSMEDGTERIPL